MEARIRLFALSENLLELSVVSGGGILPGCCMLFLGFIIF